MPLTGGSRLGPYEIVSMLGEGGMGQVYRAIDLNLKRTVALKVLPESSRPIRIASRGFSAKPKSGRAESSEHRGHLRARGAPRQGRGRPTALVMELVEGATLAERLMRGANPHSPRALLDRAADRRGPRGRARAGIVHRDLKPANIKVRPDDTVKVLDFGLAKAMVPGGRSRQPDVTKSPTMTSPAMTQMGMILGTAAYMAPEQAKGRPVDRRADVWAFGAVLYEMLTGTRAFAGDDVSGGAGVGAGARAGLVEVADGRARGRH